MSRLKKAESTVKAYRLLSREGSIQAEIYCIILIENCNRLYVNELKRNNCRISMTQDGSPYDNAVAERINGILKDEYFCDEQFDSFELAKKHVEQSIMIYNNKRPHLSCSMLKPYQMHLQCTFPVKKWNKKTSLLRREVVK